ncbi:MAG: hypothetical protein J0I98_11540 [Mesorhizobium sp.]|nr:hypothetical protein [Mesorhizobium sp.]MBN9243417.1 hypothetical protein [Mesorhizobium sp.]
MARARGDSLTGDLLTWEPPKVVAGFAEGAVRGSRIANQISQVVRLALEDQDRGKVAERMSGELGYTVSRDLLDHYASEGAEAHKITLERFIALIEATGCVDALAFVAERFDHVVVPSKYAAIVEYHLLDEHEQEVTRRKQAAFAKMKGGR